MIDIKEDSLIEDILSKCPKSIDVFKKYNIQVIICDEVVWDNLRDIANKNGVESLNPYKLNKKCCNN